MENFIARNLTRQVEINRACIDTAQALDRAHHAALRLAPHGADYRLYSGELKQDAIRRDVYHWQRLMADISILQRRLVDISAHNAGLASDREIGVFAVEEPQKKTPAF